MVFQVKIIRKGKNMEKYRMTKDDIVSVQKGKQDVAFYEEEGKIKSWRFEVK